MCGLQLCVWFYSALFYFFFNSLHFSGIISFIGILSSPYFTRLSLGTLYWSSSIMCAKLSDTYLCSKTMCEISELSCSEQHYTGLHPSRPKR